MSLHLTQMMREPPLAFLKRLLRRRASSMVREQEYQAATNKSHAADHQCNACITHEKIPKRDRLDG
jgi:hypothetical protein